MKYHLVDSRVGLFTKQPCAHASLIFTLPFTCMRGKSFPVVNWPLESVHERLYESVIILSHFHCCLLQYCKLKIWVDTGLHENAHSPWFGFLLNISVVLCKQWVVCLTQDQITAVCIDFQNATFPNDRIKSWNYNLLSSLSCAFPHYSSSSCLVGMSTNCYVNLPWL